MFHLSIPDEIDKQIASLTDDKESFVFAAIRQKLAKQKEEINPELLAKQYAESVAENKAIMDDYKHSDLENWDDY